MEISTFGGTGYAGRHIAREAADRGHTVIGYSRSAPADPIARVDYRTGSVPDEQTRSAALDGADAVVLAFVDEIDTPAHSRQRFTVGY